MPTPSRKATPRYIAAILPEPRSELIPRVPTCERVSYTDPESRDGDPAAVAQALAGEFVDAGDAAEGDRMVLTRVDDAAVFLYTLAEVQRRVTSVEVR